MDGRSRGYSVPPSSASETAPPPPPPNAFPATSEDLHAWSIYRQNLNSDFTDSALGSSEKSPLPYGNFHLRESTMQSILANPKYGPRSELGTNMFTYLKFGLPRVLPPGMTKEGRDNSSGYDSTDEDIGRHRLRAARSEDFLTRTARMEHLASAGRFGDDHRKLKSISEANLLHASADYDTDVRRYRSKSLHRSVGHLAQSERDLQNGAFVNRALDAEEEEDDEDSLDDDEIPASRIGPKAKSQLSVMSRHSKASRSHLQNGGVSYRHEAPMLNDKYFPKDTFGSSHFLGGPVQDYDGFKYPHLQLRGVSFDVKVGRQHERVLESITMEAKGGDIVAIMATKSESDSFELFLREYMKAFE